MQFLYWMSLSLAKNHAVAKDLVQDTYREAWMSFARYEPRSTLCWLFRREELSRANPQGLD